MKKLTVNTMELINVFYFKIKMRLKMPKTGGDVFTSHNANLLTNHITIIICIINPLNSKSLHHSNTRHTRHRIHQFKTTIVTHTVTHSVSNANSHNKNIKSLQSAVFAENWIGVVDARDVNALQLCIA
jgi:hypothetical protein